MAIDSLRPKAGAAPAADSKDQEKEEILIRCVYDGIMAGDLPGRKASGKRFRVNVLIVLKIDGRSGKIERVDEYYTATLDEGCDVWKYKLVSGRRGLSENKGKGRSGRAEKL